MAKRKVVKVITTQPKEKNLDKELNYNFMNYINITTQVRKRQAREERIVQTMEWMLLIGLALVIIVESIN